MTRLNQITPHGTTAGQRTRRPAHGPAREARTRRSDDAVLASYIRELSAAGEATPRPRAERQPQGC